MPYWPLRITGQQIFAILAIAQVLALVVDLPVGVSDADNTARTQ